MIDLLLLLVLFGPEAKRVNAVLTRSRTRAFQSPCPLHRKRENRCLDARFCFSFRKNPRKGTKLMSRIVRFHQTGGPEVLRIDEVEVRTPKAGEVRIAVKALGLNRAESMFRLGQYLEEPSFPARLGYEAAGTVEAVGEGVQGFRPGDVVSTIPAFSQEEYGVY